MSQALLTAWIKVSKHGNETNLCLSWSLHLHNSSLRRRIFFDFLSHAYRWAPNKAAHQSLYIFYKHREYLVSIPSLYSINEYWKIEANYCFNDITDNIILRTFYYSLEQKEYLSFKCLMPIVSFFAIRYCNRFFLIYSHFHDYYFQDATTINYI